jgi:hypothetical protein
MPHHGLNSDGIPAAADDQETEDMADIVFIAVALAFFALCVAYIRGLDRMVRAAEEADATHEVAA